MADEPNRNELPIEEQLVSYLDGEMDAEMSRQLEERLAGETEVRQALQGLDRTWELLDELETPTVAGTFTQSTLEMVAAAAADEAKQCVAAAPWRRRRRWLFAAGSLAAAGLAGFLAVAMFAPNPDRQLVENLGVLENVDGYRQIDDVEFLQMLHDEGLFVDLPDDDPPDDDPSDDDPSDDGAPGDEIPADEIPADGNNTGGEEAGDVQ